MSLKSKIETMVRNKQRGIRFTKGDQFWRGGILIVIKKVDRESVKFREIDSGNEETETRRGFVSRALIRVPRADTGDGDMLKRAWAVVGTRGLPVEYRLKAAQRFVRQAEDMKVKGRIQSWLYALSMGREPKK